VYQYEGFLEQFAAMRKRIQELQALLSPTVGRLPCQKRRWACGTLKEMEHRLFVLARLYGQAFSMLNDAAAHTPLRRGGKHGGDARSATIRNERHEKIRQVARELWAVHPGWTTHAIAQALREKLEGSLEQGKLLSVRHISRIIQSVNAPPES
jgi:hypothetical protein